MEKIINGTVIGRPIAMRLPIGEDLAMRDVFHITVRVDHTDTCVRLFIVDSSLLAKSFLYPQDAHVMVLYHPTIAGRIVSDLLRIKEE